MAEESFEGLFKVRELDPYFFYQKEICPMEAPFFGAHGEKFIMFSVSMMDFKEIFPAVDAKGMTAGVLDHFCFSTANVAYAYSFFGFISFLIPYHFSASLFLVNDIVELLFIKPAETEEHEVPGFREAGEVGFFFVFLINFGCELIELIDIVGFFLRGRMLKLIIGFFFPIFLFFRVFILLFFHIFFI